MKTDITSCSGCGESLPDAFDLSLGYHQTTELSMPGGTGYIGETDSLGGFMIRCKTCQMEHYVAATPAAVWEVALNASLRAIGVRIPFALFPALGQKGGLLPLESLEDCGALMPGSHLSLGELAGLGLTVLSVKPKLPNLDITQARMLLAALARQVPKTILVKKREKKPQLPVA